MEMIKNIQVPWLWCRHLFALLLMLFSCGVAYAQYPLNSVTVKKGHMYISIAKEQPAAALDSFMVQFDLEELDLNNFLKNNKPDSLLKMGWNILLNNSEILILSKNMAPADKLDDPVEKILLAQKHFGNAGYVNKQPVFGVNRFSKKYPFAVQDSIVSFFYRGAANAQRVMLAGSFNNWNPDALAMQKVDSGWIALVKLGAGKHYYKFIADGKWMTDKDNQLVENDGEGNDNSVYYKTNHVFRLDGYQKSKRVNVAGSFNNWDGNDIKMERTADGWAKDVYLAHGTHTYRFVADGNWFADPANSNAYPNEFGETNSVIAIGEPHLFFLEGYPHAKKVMLIGSFNQWRNFELSMHKTDSGWVLPYVLDRGNHSYNFEIDGHKPKAADGKDAPNRVLVFAPNHTFTLKGFADAKRVYLAGDFNNWSPDGFIMKRVGDEWMIPQHLSAGKHIYKFAVDGKWIVDPANLLREPNEFGQENSVIWK